MFSNYNKDSTNLNAQKTVVCPRFLSNRSYTTLINKGEKMYNTFKPEQPVGLMDFVKAAKSCVKEITPAELKAKLDAKQDFVLVDVRESAEFEHGHIDGAHLVPRGIIEAAADTSYPKHYPPLSGARDQQIVLYCATSGRSAMAAAVLQMMGFKHVLNLAGGYTRWEAEGMPQVKEAEY